MNWHLIGSSGLGNTSLWYKTKKDAQYSKARIEKVLLDDKYNQTTQCVSR